MPLVFRVTNSGNESVTLYLMGRTPAADFRISDEDGRIIWSRLHGQTVLGALRLYPLGAGEALAFRHVWNGRSDSGGVVPPGKYAIRGVLLTDELEGWASPPAGIHIER